MAEVRRRESFAAPAEEVWALVGDYNGLPAWHPGIESSQLEQDGAIRRLTLADGAGEVVELLEAHDHDGRTYRYRIVESGLPVEDYVSTLTVHEVGDAAHVEWTSTFEAVGVSDDEAITIIEGIYDAGLGSLKERFGG
jgi:carbon monoxide dehydrogenase subunit G